MVTTAATATPKQKWGWGAANALVLLIVAVPVWWLISLSFKDPSTISDGTFIPRKWTLENYKGIFTTSEFIRPLINSLGICLIATVIAVVLASSAAYAVARIDFPGKQILVGSSLLIAIFPPIALATPLFNLWRILGLFDTLPGLIIPYITLTLPLSIWILTAFFQQIPWEMEQAAQVDGASSWEAFVKVVAPLALPGVFTTAIIAFFVAWNDFVFSSNLTAARAQTVPAALNSFTGASQFTQPTGAICAAAVVVTIPVVILVLVFQRRIVAGLTSGAVKG